MKILAIDGNSILNRAFYGIRPLTTKSGEFTNGVYGFLNILFKLVDETSPDGVIVAYDLKKPTFRHQEFSEYKAGRKAMPDELGTQFPLLKELINLLGYQNMECEGYEADDILGTIARKSETENVECIIATGDRDSFQLVSDKTAVRFTSTKMSSPEVTVYNLEKIREEYGLKPKQLIDVKAIEGDKSDNIPGVAGIGKVGARKLIQLFGSLDGVYENIDSPEIKQGVREKLIANKENAYLSLKLGEIFCDVPCVKELSSYKKKEISKSELKAFLLRLEFFKAISKLGLDKIENSAQQEKSVKYTLFVGNIKDFIKNSAELFLYEDGGKYFICNKTQILNTEISELENIDDFRDKLIVYDYKDIYRKLKDKGLLLNGVSFDISLAGYLLNPSASNYNIGRLFDEYNTPLAEFDFDAEEDVKTLARLPMLYEKLKSEIQESGMAELLKAIEIPFSKVLADMEAEGFLLDKGGLIKFGKEIEYKLRAAEENIYTLAGEEFNINSPKQLSVILFEKLELPGGKKTKSGYSTNAEILEGLIDKHKIIPEILDYRALAKLKSTYVDGLLKVITGNGRVYTTFNQKETRTGRISSSEPNLQNIPVKSKLGKELRRFFMAGEGKSLVDADYSQIELRVLADIANDKTMISAFKNNEDIHTLTASQVFKVTPLEVDDEMRGKAKAVNFGIVYGIGAFSLAKDIKVSNYEASQYIKGYLNTYSSVARYMDETIEKAKANGYVTTAFGRRRPLPEILSGNANLRKFGERVARNMPIQGTAADIIKIAMINVYNRLEKENLKAKLILQVHDEVIVESPDDEVPKVLQILKEEMEGAGNLKVNLTVDANVGKTWYEAKG